MWVQIPLSAPFKELIMGDIAKIKELRQKTGIGLAEAKRFLDMADYNIELAEKIAEYYGLAMYKTYPVGRIIREFWEAKTREWCW